MKVKNSFFFLTLFSLIITCKEKLINKVAVNGAWINDSTYQLRAYLFVSPARIIYNFFFENDQFSIEKKLEHALFGWPDIVEFKGSVK